MVNGVVIKIRQKMGRNLRLQGQLVEGFNEQLRPEIGAPDPEMNNLTNLLAAR
jgi:hypothetical protein